MVTICRSWHLSLWTMFIKQNNLPIFHHSTRNNPLITSSHRCFTLSFTAERFIMEYSSDQLNYFRICYIAFNLIPKGFGKSSDKNWISATKKAWENGKIRQGMVRTSTRTIPRRVIRKILITWQHCRMGKQKNGIAFTYFFALLLSDSIGSTASAAIRKDIDDLRQVNDIAHSGEATITDTKFQNYVGRVLNALNSLSLLISDIITIKNQKSFPIAEVNNLRAKAANSPNRATNSG